MASSVETIGRVFAKRVGNASVAPTAASVYWDVFRIAIEHVNREISAVERKFGVEYIRAKPDK